MRGDVSDIKHTINTWGDRQAYIHRAIAKFQTKDPHYLLEDFIRKIQVYDKRVKELAKYYPQMAQRQGQKQPPLVMHRATVGDRIPEDAKDRYCWGFQEGKCTRGEECRFPHVMSQEWADAIPCDKWEENSTRPPSVGVKRPVGAVESVGILPGIADRRHRSQKGRGWRS